MYLIEEQDAEAIVPICDFRRTADVVGHRRRYAGMGVISMGGMVYDGRVRSEATVRAGM